MPLPLPDLLTFIEFAALGLIAGFMAGLLGIGGGMLLVPGLTWLLTRLSGSPDLAVKMAIATAMATIVATSLSSIAAHHRKGAVQWNLVAGLSPGIVLGGLLAGAGIFNLLSGQWLALGFAVFIAYSATRMYFGSTVAADQGMPGRGGQFAAGGAIGLLSGIVGAGGGFISVPYMTRRRVPLHHAVGTSAALGLPVAVSSVIGYAVAGWDLQTAVPGAWGYFHLVSLLTIVLFSLPMAQVGARVAHALPAKTLRKAFAILLYGLACYMAWHGLKTAFAANG